MPERLTPRRLRAYIDKEISVSDWLVMSQDRIDAFAACTEDRQWIHVDREKAVRGPLKSTVAHGALLLSLLPFFVQDSSLFRLKMKMAVSYGFDKVRFIHPVRPGDRIRNIAVLRQFERRGFRKFLLKIENRMEIDGEENPAMVVESLFLVYL